MRAVNMGYTPDYWKLVKITSDSGTVYKVLGHWIGGYTHGDSWRLNSGIESIAFDKTANMYVVHGYSGSVYNCHATCEHISQYMMSIIDGYLYKAQSDARDDIKIEFVNIEDWLNDK